MGGTYWYYYRLDDDIDFYNEAEPSTTACPFLPGQQVNVLSVPIYLPSVERHHYGDDSTRCVTPTHQTMNPEDKYINPRPPPHPKLRLNTSPGMFLNTGPWSSPPTTSPKRPFHGRSSSHPREVQTRRKFKFGRSTPKSTNSESPSTRNFIQNLPSPVSSRKGTEHASSGLGYRPAKFISNSLGSRNDMIEYLGVDRALRGFGLCSNCSSPLKTPIELLSQDHMHAPLITSYGSHKSSNLRCTAGDSTPKPQGPPVPPRINNTRRLTVSRNDVVNPAFVYPHEPEVVPNQDRETTTYLVTCKLDIGRNTPPSPVDLNSKRLPTLPNSPSSALEEELASYNHTGPDLNVLRSHFSVSTAESTDLVSNFFPVHGRSHFSDLTIDSQAISPSSMTSASTFNSDSSNSKKRHELPVVSPVTDAIPSNNPPARGPIALEREQSWQINLSNHDSLLSSCSSHHERGLGVSGLYIAKQTDQNFPQSTTTQQQNDDRNASRSSSSPPTLRSPSRRASSSSHSRGGQGIPKERNSSFVAPRSACRDEYQSSIGNVQSMMQELIDEMSYLANMIQERGTDAC
ncbi:hypothetical protein VTO42DRAFT_3377 [Malbranchea cinnamomea]